MVGVFEFEEKASVSGKARDEDEEDLRDRHEDQHLNCFKSFQARTAVTIRY